MRDDMIEKMRGVARDCINKHLYSSAIFYSDKVATFTGDPVDIYMQAQSLFLGGHYRRAFHLLNAPQILRRDLRFRYLAAKCLEELKEWDQCLSMLSDASDVAGDADKNSNVMYLDEETEDDYEISISSAICFLRGKASEAVQNRADARKWYKAAVKSDPLCYEALERLIENHMLTCDEEKELLSSLEFVPGDEWLSDFYSCLIKKYEKEEVVEMKFGEEGGSEESASSGLRNNSDVLACKAEYYHQCGEYQKSFELTFMLLERDPFHLKSTLVHIASAVDLGNSNELYLWACNLVKDYPQKALSWFAVGCYYHVIRNFDSARTYFRKATELDPTFPPAWIGQANSLSAKGEGDNAMSVYRTAARNFPGCHLPTLYIGMEYLRTHNYKLAQQFFLQAKSICPSDHLVYNELGVVAYHMKDFKNAVLWFERTLSLVPSVSSDTWESTLVNLAHSLRKLGRYDEAISFYDKALASSTKSSTTYAGLAYTYHLLDNYSAAINYYHKALWLKPDDQFSIDMLDLALLDECHTSDPVAHLR